MVGHVTVRSDRENLHRSRAGLITILVSIALLSGCILHKGGLLPSLSAPQIRQREPASGVRHTVKPGETLRDIARTYAVDIQRIAEVNNLGPPFVVGPGTRLFIPGAVRDRAVRADTRSANISGKVRDRAGTLAWPVRGRVVSEFGVRNGVQRNGIEIESVEGTPVRAAAAGRIGYAGPMKGYGRVVIIEHENRLLTVYAHLDDDSSARGAKVEKGEVIGHLRARDRGRVGSLYFEVRHRSKPRNPRYFLPKRNPRRSPSRNRRAARSLPRETRYSIISSLPRSMPIPHLRVLCEQREPGRSRKSPTPRGERPE
jgi:LysM repeat protein